MKEPLSNLLRYVKPDAFDDHREDKDWVDHGIKLLSKRIMNDREWKKFEEALFHESKRSTCCLIKISSSQKRRSQFGYYHTVAIRLFRFPWVRSAAELRSVSTCSTPYSKKREIYCINPYHYDVVKGPPLPPIAVEKNRVSFPTMIMMDLNEEDVAPNADATADMMRVIPNDDDSEAPTPNPASPYSVSPHSCLSEDSMDIDDDLRSRALADNPPSGPDAVVEMVKFKDPEHWLSLAYYEMGQRVGPAFNCNAPYVMVDGMSGTANADIPVSSQTCRFSVGYFTNLTRDRVISENRRKIGRGLRIYSIGGEIYMENLSEHSVFMQSPLCNQRHGWPTATVLKVAPHCVVKMFNTAEFAIRLTNAVKSYEEVYALTRLCTVRLSFVKGWGKLYQRAQVTTVPCWLEGHLNGPLQWIDRVLQTMGAPPKMCGSVS